VGIGSTYLHVVSDVYWVQVGILFIDKCFIKTGFKNEIIETNVEVPDVTTMGVSSLIWRYFTRLFENQLRYCCIWIN